MSAYHRAPATLITELAAGADQAPTVASARWLGAQGQALRYLMAAL